MALKDNRRELFELVARYGFALHRQTKHYVFKNAQGKTVVCSKSTMDKRSLKNVERDIKRALAS